MHNIHLFILHTFIYTSYPAINNLLSDDPDAITKEGHQFQQHIQLFYLNEDKEQVQGNQYRKSRINQIDSTSNQNSIIILSTATSIHTKQKSNVDSNFHNSHHDDHDQNHDFSTFYLNLNNANEPSPNRYDNGRFLDFENFMSSDSISSSQSTQSQQQQQYDDNNVNSMSEGGEVLSTKLSFTQSNPSMTMATDEARYNLATRIMSNGVEVIVANDKNKYNTQASHNKQSVIKISPSNLHKPMTLAPSTLKDQMILVMPSDKKNNLTISINPNQFLTKTCLTTYTYRTTYLQDGTTKVESREKVISNIATEERNYMKISPTASSGIVLSKTPELAVGIFRTTYKYLNTFIDGEQPIVVSSKHVVTNTITGPNDYISFLQPSANATPVHDTNTYFTKIMMTKTYQKHGTSKILSTSNILTQVVVTESLPPKSISVMTSYIAFDEEDDEDSVNVHFDGTTLTQMTHLNDNQDKNINSNKPTNENTKNKNNPNKLHQKHKSTTSPYHHTSTPHSKIKITKTQSPQVQIKPTTSVGTSSSILSSSISSQYTSTNIDKIDNFDFNDIPMPQPTYNSDNNIHIFATKTYLTTFTYFTTLLKSNEHEVSSTIINSHTRVTENVITETIPHYILNSNLLKTLSHLLFKHNSKNAKGITTMATFPGGQSLEITAMPIIPSKVVSNNKFHATSTKQVVDNHKNNHQASALYLTTSSSTLSSSFSSNNIFNEELNDEGPSATNNDGNNSSNGDGNNKISATTHNDDDNEAAGTSNDDVYDDQYNYQNYDSLTGSTKNETKLTHYNQKLPEFPSPVSNLISSLNFDGLTALGPVFNAMAGLIQNNFKSTATTSNAPSKKQNDSIFIDNRHSLKNITSTNQHEHPSHHHGPIYIPVQNVHTENNENIHSITHGNPISLHVSPPPIPEKWISEEKLNRNNKIEGPQTLSSLPAGIDNSNKMPHEKPLLNGGIPISPGEVITANSDVIVGKPVGTLPRIPFDGKLVNEQNVGSTSSTKSTANGVKQIPISKYLENNNANGIIDKHYEQYMRPPPPPPPPSIPLSPPLTSEPLNFKHFLKLPETGGSNIRKRLPHHHSGPKIPLKYHQPQNEYNMGHQHHKTTSSNFHQHKPPHLQHQEQHYQHNQEQHHQYHQEQQHHYQQQYQQHQKPPIKSIPINTETGSDSNGINVNANPVKIHSEILEIKKVPEIYSTNLPPFEIYAHQHSHVKKVISSGNPMLVNIQPSQIANVVIPHGNSASVLIIESPVELHKNGEYFDEPSPYPNTIFDKSSDTQDNLTDNTYHNDNNTGGTRKKPILSNQQINLHAGVLSHNVDINVPPLTFKKEVEFPQSTPIQGQHQQSSNIRKNGPFEMPHITILPTEQEIHVNLTPHNYIPTDIFIQNNNQFNSVQLPAKRKPFQNHHDQLDSMHTNVTKTLENVPIRIPISQDKYLDPKPPASIPMQNLLNKNTNRSPNIPLTFSYQHNNNKYASEKYPYSQQLEFHGPPISMPPRSPPPNGDVFQRQRYAMSSLFKDPSSGSASTNQKPLPISLLKLPSHGLNNNYQGPPPPFKYQPAQKLRPVSHIPSIENIFDIQLNDLSTLSYKTPSPSNASFENSNQINNRTTPTFIDDYFPSLITYNQTFNSIRNKNPSTYDTINFDADPVLSSPSTYDVYTNSFDLDSKSSEQNPENYYHKSQTSQPSSFKISSPPSSVTSLPIEYSKKLPTNMTTTTSLSSTPSLKAQNLDLMFNFDTPSASAINNELHTLTIDDHQSQSSKHTIFQTPPSKGRPFNIRQPLHTKKPTSNTHQQSVYYQPSDLLLLPKPGERFRKPKPPASNVPKTPANIYTSQMMTTSATYNGGNDNITNNLLPPPLIQVSLPIDLNPNDIDENSPTQTETPFNYYNQNNVGTNANDVTLTNHIQQTSNKIPIATTVNLTNLELNTLEVVTKPKLDNENKESSEIFDYRESVNPHNLGIVTQHTANLHDGTHKIYKSNSHTTSKPKFHYGYRKTTSRIPSIFIPSTTSYPSYMMISKPSMNMKPPTPSAVPPTLVTNEVMGLSPPPPPTSLSPPPSVPSSSSSSGSIYDTTLIDDGNFMMDNKRKIPSQSKPIIFSNHSTISNNLSKQHSRSNFTTSNQQKGKFSEITTTKTASLHLSESKISTSTKRPSKTTTTKRISTISTTRTSPRPVFIPSPKTTDNDSKKSQSKTEYQISPTPILKNEIPDHDSVSHSKSNSNKYRNDSNQSSVSHRIYTSMMDESQAISDDILVLGTEHQHNRHTYDITKSIIYPSSGGLGLRSTMILVSNDTKNDNDNNEEDFLQKQKFTIKDETKSHHIETISKKNTENRHKLTKTTAFATTTRSIINSISTSVTKPTKLTAVTHKPEQEINTKSISTLMTVSTSEIPTIIEIVTKAHTERVYPTKVQHINTYTLSIDSDSNNIPETTTSVTLTKSNFNQNKNYYDTGVHNGTVIVLNPPVRMKSKFTNIPQSELYENTSKKTEIATMKTSTFSFHPTSILSSISIAPSSSVQIQPSTMINLSKYSYSSSLPSSYETSTTVSSIFDQSHPLSSSTSLIHKLFEKHHKDLGGHRKETSPTASISSALPTENESIFVVMTDKSNSGGIIHFNGTVLNADHSVDEPDYTSFDIPNRDEDFSSSNSNEANHVLLGGILIASPPKSKDISKYSGSMGRGNSGNECRPDCRPNRNELCQRIENVMRCVCRPGFARMFPDRPCKPTYTYSLKLKLHRFGSDILYYHEHLNNKESDAYYYLSGLTYEALDRMVMQSDFRDVYHGVHVTGFEKSEKNNGIISNFYLQLSDNSNENRLVDVFRKYLRTKNYSIGGTELYTSSEDIDELKASDFDECLHPQFHDCSENSYCFNLHGTYTCSCKEGYADLSENSLYPGRICSTELIGCEQCHYHGTCYTPDDLEHPICECFHWYAGSSCQINLKILLIALIAIGTILLILLCFCVGILCVKKCKKSSSSTTRSIQTLAGINIMPPKNLRHHFNQSSSSSCTVKTDKRAMIKDTSSEASHNSDTLPYNMSKKEEKKSNVSQNQSSQKANVQCRRLQQQQQQQQQQNQSHHYHHHQQQQQAQIIHEQELDEHHCNLLEQSNRSISVMIPRAKYHSGLLLSEGATVGGNRNNAGSNGNSGGGGGGDAGDANSKVLSYLDAGAQNNLTKKYSSASTKHSALHTTSTGALVSAGFEVSATVRPDIAGVLSSSGDENAHQKLLGVLECQNHHQEIFDTFKTNESQQAAFIDNMDNWFDSMQQNELTASEARSYDETTIRPPTKSLRSVYEKHVSQLNDEANTMAEREVGSTFLLPHTHLYKPDRASDMSGFDSF